jgi:hypothetical protein
VLKDYDKSVSDLYSIVEDPKTDENSKAIFWALIGKIVGNKDSKKEIESYKRSFEAFSHIFHTKDVIKNVLDQNISEFGNWYQWFKNVSTHEDFSDLLRDWLLDALCRDRGSLDRDAVKEFYEIASKIIKIPWISSKGNLVTGNADFLIKMASVYAEKGMPELTQNCLENLWAIHPDKDFWLVVKDQHIKSIISKTDLLPEFAKELRYKMLKRLIITNISSYAVTNVFIKINVEYKAEEPETISKKIKKIKSGDSVDLSKSLPGGIWGTDIKEITVDISCDEERYIKM